VYLSFSNTLGKEESRLIKLLSFGTSSARTSPSWQWRSCWARL